MESGGLGWFGFFLRSIFIAFGLVWEKSSVFESQRYVSYW